MQCTAFVLISESLIQEILMHLSRIKKKSLFNIFLVFKFLKEPVKILHLCRTPSYPRALVGSAGIRGCYY